MKISQKQSDILSAVEHQAEASLKVIGQQTGHQESTVRYYLDRLVSSKIIRRKRFYINPYLIGFSNYVIYFSIASASEDSSKKFLMQLRKLPEIVWLSELGGNYHFGASLSLSHVSEAPIFFEKFANSLSASVIEKTFSVRLRVITFGKRYLSSKKLPQIWLEQGGSPKFKLSLIHI